MPEPGLSVLLADDHALIRRGLAGFLADHLAITRLGEASSAETLLAAALAGPWDLVITDYSMPGGDGIGTLQALRKLLPRTPVVVLSMLPEDQFAVAALAAGASAFVGKQRPNEILLQAIDAVMAGRSFVPADVQDGLSSPTLAGRPAGGVLSARERAVLRLLGQGMKPAQIAEEMHLSVKTVATYRTRIMEKLDLKNQAQLLRYAVTHGIFQ